MGRLLGSFHLLGIPAVSVITIKLPGTAIVRPGSQLYDERGVKFSGESSSSPPSLGMLTTLICPVIPARIERDLPILVGKNKMQYRDEKWLVRTIGGKDAR